MGLMAVALSGLTHPMARCPGRCPGLSNHCPFGALELFAPSPERATRHQPRATPWGIRAVPAHGKAPDARISIDRPSRGSTGTTLLELLTSILFVSILMAMSYSFARSALMNARVQETTSETQEVILMAMDLLTREVRMAGYSAGGPPIFAVRVAEAEQLEVATDLDGDGSSGGPNELVSYGYNEVKRQLVRATGGASAQPLLRNVPPGGLRFSFLDADGLEIAIPAGGLPQAARQQIHRIDVALRTEIPAEQAGGAPFVSSMTGSVCLRNQ